MRPSSRARRDQRHMKRTLVRWAGDHRRAGSGLDEALARIDLATVLPVTVPRSLRYLVKVRRGGLQFVPAMKLAYLEGYVWPQPICKRSPFLAMLKREEH